MKLLDVNAVLDRETHIQQADPECEVLKEDNSKSTRYAILSHRWSDEVGYEEMTGLMKMEEHKRDKVRQRSGYQKIIKSCKQAVKDRHEWLWIDTCCIDKRSSSELSEAINSMYQWYQNAQVCYAYLSDVDELPRPTMPYHLRSICRPNGWLGPEWFTRGWTLQELIAPRELEFFNKDWAPIGNKRHLAAVLQDITGIPREVLRDGLGAKPLSVAQIMSWAAGRKTQRVEDRAYSLMGLFGVNMPMLYGEGEKAFQRLQLEIIRTSSDQSIFAWNRRKPRTGSVLADDPSDFAGCGRIEKVEPDEFVDKLTKYIEWNVLGPTLYFRSNSRKISTNPIHWCRLAWLRWRARVVSQQHHLSFSVSNAGIQVCLPVIPLPDSRNHFRAILPCGRHFGLETIDLVFSGSRYLRTSAASSPILESPILKTYPEFKTLCLTHHQDANQTHREFTLDDKHASYHHFTRRGTYPREFTGNTVSLSSLIDDLVVIVYANDDAGFRFAVGLGYYHGQGWVHVVCDKPAIQKDWTSFAPEAYHRMWDARVEHAQRMFKQDPVHGRCACVHFIKHAHLPQSIWAARVVWSRWEKGDFTIMVDVEQCPGCCDGPHGWTATLNHYHGPQMPGLMYICSHPYSLRLDGWEVELDESSDQRIALGDYGDYSNGTFMRVGNIFEDAGILSIDTMGSTYCPVVPHVSSFLSLMSRHHTENEDDLVVAYHSGRKHLALRQPKVFSLPANDHLVRLLKALATRLAGKHLVLTVVQCSEFYGVDDNGERRDSVDDSVPDSNNHPAEGDISTPLCIIASPQVWRREMPCVQRREQFKSIREHFYALVNTRQPTGTDARHKAANGQQKDGAIKFFSDMFGLRHLNHYVGKILFFEKLPSMMESDSLSEVSAGSAEEDGLLARTPKLSCADWVMTCNLFKGSWQSNSTQDPHLEVVLPVLSKRCRTLCAERGAPRRYANEKQKVERELKSISQTLSVDLIRHIRCVFFNAYLEHEHSTTRQASRIEYDRQLNIPSMIEEVEALQAKLDATVDEDEQRALEEDVTGKILWLCWCGICAEVDQLLPKVVGYIRREGNMKGLVTIAFITCSTDSGDDQAHLRRIMFDAGEGTSKHQLWLATRAAEQAKWSRDTPAVDDPGSVPSTSNQPPSASVV